MAFYIICRYVHLFVLVFVFRVGEGWGRCFVFGGFGAGFGEANLAGGLYVGVVVVHDSLHLVKRKKSVDCFFLLNIIINEN